MTPTRHHFSPAVFAALLGIVNVFGATSIPEDCKIGGFALGCQAYTFKNFTAFEAVEKTAQAGGRIIEFFPGQKLSPEQPDLKLHHDATDETVAAVKVHLAKH